MMTELDIVKKYLKIPYKRGGMDPAKGLNCWGLVKGVYADLGRPVHDIEDFVKQCPASERQKLEKIYASAFVEVPTPGPFDMVLLSLDSYMHAGVVLSEGKFIHMCKAGAVVCRLGHPYWKPKILGYYGVVNNA